MTEIGNRRVEVCSVLYTVSVYPSNISGDKIV